MGVTVGIGVGVGVGVAAGVGVTVGTLSSAAIASAFLCSLSTFFLCWSSRVSASISRINRIMKIGVNDKKSVGSVKANMVVRINVIVSSF